jgi:hypothetical protein
VPNLSRSNMVIHKYPVEVGTTRILMNKVVRYLHVGEQTRKLYLWALVEEGSQELRTIAVCGTGIKIPKLVSGESLEFLGTVQTESGLVWHVFDYGVTETETN